MNKYIWAKSITTISLIFLATTIVYLYTNGFRIHVTKEQVLDISKTGMVSARSIPESANVYLDGILITATNDTIPGIEPGTKTLKILKKGFVPWEKEIEIFQELVTDITAVLITQSPRIEPLTNTGALFPKISNSLTKLAYISKEETTKGINILNLSSGFFSGNPTITIKDTNTIKLSEGTDLLWSYNENELLVKLPKEQWYLINLTDNSLTTVTNTQKVIQKWEEEFLQKRSDFIDKSKVSDDVKELAKSNNVLWSPDEKKFLATTEIQNQIIYKVHNLEDPLPVGEKQETEVIIVPKNQNQPKVTWYSDSYHLILVDDFNINNDSNGKISFIRIDGTNKTEIYNNKLFSDNVFSTPSGDKVIILTSFRSNGQTDIYTVSIR